jgi:hypothetical protein
MANTDQEELRKSGEHRQQPHWPHKVLSASTDAVGSSSHASGRHLNATAYPPTPEQWHPFIPPSTATNHLHHPPTPPISNELWISTPQPQYDAWPTAPSPSTPYAPIVGEPYGPLNLSSIYQQAGDHRGYPRAPASRPHHSYFSPVPENNFGAFQTHAYGAAGPAPIFYPQQYTTAGSPHPQAQHPYDPKFIAREPFDTVPSHSNHALQSSYPDTGIFPSHHNSALQAVTPQIKSSTPLPVPPSYPLAPQQLPPIQLWSTVPPSRSRKGRSHARSVANAVLEQPRTTKGSSAGLTQNAQSTDRLDDDSRRKQEIYREKADALRQRRASLRRTQNKSQKDAAEATKFITIDPARASRVRPTQKAPIQGKKAVRDQHALSLMPAPAAGIKREGSLNVENAEPPIVPPSFRQVAPTPEADSTYFTNSMTHPGLTLRQYSDDRSLPLSGGPNLVTGPELYRDTVLYPPKPDNLYHSVTPVAKPLPWDDMAQDIVTSYTDYKWSVKLYKVNREKTGFEFAMTWLDHLLASINYKLTHAWFKHETDGFIKDGDHLCFVLLHNATFPFEHRYHISSTTFAYHEHSEERLSWVTVAPDLRSLLASALAAGQIEEIGKWSFDMKASQARFHKAYWLAANMHPLGRLLARAPLTERMLLPVKRDQDVVMKEEPESFGEDVNDGSQAHDNDMENVVFKTEPVEEDEPVDLEDLDISNDGIGVPLEEAQVIWKQCLEDAKRDSTPEPLPESFVIGSSERP